MTPLSLDNKAILRDFFQDPSKWETTLNKLGLALAGESIMGALPKVTLEEYFQLKLLAQTCKSQESVKVSIFSSQKEIDDLIDNPKYRTQKTNIKNLNLALETFEGVLKISKWPLDHIMAMYDNCNKMREHIAETEQPGGIPEKASTEIDTIKTNLEEFLAQPITEISGKIEDDEPFLLKQVNTLLDNISGRLKSIEEMPIKDYPANTIPVENLSAEKKPRGILAKFVREMHQTVTDFKNLVAKILHKNPKETSKTDPETKTDSLSMN